MPRIKRRHFLQIAGSTLATLGLSQLDIRRQSDRYGRVLAQGTPRKLALLVGINDYKASPLQGCVTDVKLQEQLLIHRFGFNPKDIVILTNEKATRQGIVTAFEEHLIKQAKPGDVVVYHFSGHGSRVDDPDRDAPDGKNSTFVPIDSSLSAGGQGSVAPEIMGHTMFLLMYALQTENVTFVLDSCHSGGGTRGNFRVRSLGNSPAEMVRDEQEYQEQWLSKLGLSREKFKELRRKGIAKGVAIAATRRDQLAADAPFNDFFAGAFTYLLTQDLWQQLGSQSFSRVMPNVTSNTTRLSFTEQEPLIEYKPGSNYSSSPFYFIKDQTPPAEAVITQVQGNQAQLWLGGLDPDSLAAFKAGAIFSAVDAQGREKGRVQLESRNGLVGTAKLLDGVQSGVLLQERSRSIPPNLSLKIGLDSSLGSDATAAKQALASIPRVEALPLQQQEVHYIFGRMTSSYQQQLRSAKVAKLPEVGSLGLFSPALELVPDSFGSPGEAVATAVTRLRAKLNSLLAARIVKTVLNTNSSRINVVAAMSLESGEQEWGTTVPLRGPASSQPAARPTIPNTRQLPLQTPVQIQVTNKESSELYVSVMVIDPSGEISVVFPNQWSAAEDATLVSAGETLQIPRSGKDKFRLITQEPKGITEVLVLASRTPLRNALQAIRAVVATRPPEEGQRGGPVTLQQNEAGQVVDSLLSDLTSGNRGSTGGSSRSGGSTSASPSGTSDRGIETNQLAALSITFEVI